MDCDDQSNTTNPGAIDAWYNGIDGNCDGASDLDADASGYDSEPHGGTDCDDADTAVHPHAIKVCDETDNDFIPRATGPGRKRTKSMTSARRQSKRTKTKKNDLKPHIKF